MTNKLLIVANWKANLSKYEILEWLALWKKKSAFTEFHLHRLEVALAPAHCYLNLLSKNYGDLWTLAAQDVSAFPGGAYTGEVTASMLADLGVHYTLIGHSERRINIKEKTTDIEKKVDQAIASGLIPIICAQTAAEIPDNIHQYDSDRYIVMYEPSEAISTEGKYHPENPESVEKVLSDWKDELGVACKFLYGGSVNQKNVKDYISLPHVSGFVVGHASLEVETFFSIIKQCLSPNRSS